MEYMESMMNDRLEGSMSEYEQMASRIAQLETELAEARKDQARYYWMHDWIEGRVEGTKEFFKAKTRSDNATGWKELIEKPEGDKQ